MLKPPQGGSWLDIKEVIKRLQSEFTQVEVVPGGIPEYGAKMAESYRNAGQPELADRVDTVKDKSVVVRVVEGDLKNALILIMLPEIPIMTGFGSEEHLEAVQPLLERCSSVLGYDLR